MHLDSGIRDRWAILLRCNVLRRILNSETVCPIYSFSLNSLERLNSYMLALASLRPQFDSNCLPTVIMLTIWFDVVIIYLLNFTLWISLEKDRRMKIASVPSCYLYIALCWCGIVVNIFHFKSCGVHKVHFKGNASHNKTLYI